MQIYQNSEGHHQRTPKGVMMAMTLLITLLETMNPRQRIVNPLLFLESERPLVFLMKLFQFLAVFFLID